MALKIERVWGTVFGQGAIKRKSSPDKDNLPKEQQRQNERQDEPSDEDARRHADRRSIETAMTDLRATADFVQAGLKVELVETAEGGPGVRLSQANGAVVKIMTAEEFLKLKENSSADQKPRGKILDQKF